MMDVTRPLPGCHLPRGLRPGRSYLYHNRGDGTFEDVSAASGIAKAKGSYMMTAVAADFDDDGWPDLYVACDSTPSFLLRNDLRRFKQLMETGEIARTRGQPAGRSTSTSRRFDDFVRR